MFIPGAHHYNHMRRLSILTSVWLLTDLVLFVLAHATAFSLFTLERGAGISYDQYILLTLYITPLWLLVMSALHTFGLMHNQHSLQSFGRIGVAGLIASMLMIILYEYAPDPVHNHAHGIDSLFMLHGLFLSTFTIWAWHIVFQRLESMAFRAGDPTFPTLVVGISHEAREMIHKLNAHQSALAPVAVLDARGSKEKDIDGVPVLGKLNKLKTVLEKEHITHVLICSNLEQSVNILEICRQKDVTCVIPAATFGLPKADETMEMMEGENVTVISPFDRMLQWFTE